MWALAAMFAVQLLQSKGQSDQLKTQNKTIKSNARIQNQLNQAQNTVASAQGALSRYKQSLGNQQILNNAAKYNEALGKNLSRLQDQAQAGNINTRLQAAERTGQLVASASAAGVGGSTVDQINQVIKGQAARLLQQNDRNTQYATSDTLERMRQVNQAAIAGLNDTTYIDRVSQVEQVANTQEVPSFAQNIGSAALSVLGSKSGQDAVGTIGAKVGSWFTTQEAGANLQVDGFNPAPAATNPQFFNVASMFGGSTQ